jgi:hypothetical protein
LYLYRYNAAMKPKIDALLEQRNLVLDHMRSIDRLRRGSLSRQFFQGRPKDPSSPRGPYFVLQGFFHGKKFSERIPAAQAPKIQEQVDNYRRFQTLAEEFVSLSDQVSRLEAGDSDRKKNSNRQRSPTSSSKKPKPS